MAGYGSFGSWGPSKKRQRMYMGLEQMGRSPAELACATQNLDETIVRKLLYDIVSHFPEAGTSVFSAWDDQRVAEAQRIIAEERRVINFDSYANDAEYVLNTKYEGHGGAAAYDLSHEADEDLSNILEKISKQVTRHSSLGTKLNALEALREIGEVIVESSGVVGHEVRKTAGSDGYFEAVIEEIICEMSEDEVELAKSYNNGELLVKFTELVSLSEGYCIFDELPGAIYKLTGGQPEGSDDEAKESAERGPQQLGHNDAVRDHHAAGAPVEVVSLLSDGE